MWIRNVLTYHISIFLVNFCFLTNYFYSFSTWTCWGLHYVHMLIICGLSIHTELPIIVWKNICLWTKWKIVWIRKHSLSPLNVFPHQVFSSKLKTLGKMINLLVLWSVFELFRFAHACPKYIPFWAVWWDNSYSCGFHSINYRVINVCWIMNFKTKRHVFVHHFVLMNDFYV